MQVYTLASGSGGNCTLLSDKGTLLLIDAGISAKRITCALAELSVTPDMLSGILITHEHSDHIAGIKTLINKYEIPIFAPRTVGNHIAYTIAGVEDFLTELSPGREDCIGGLKVLPFRTPHDTPESVGYRISGSSVFGFCTDCGHVTDEMLEGLLGCSMAVIESNHDVEMLKNGRYPLYLKQRILSQHGHLSNDDCGELSVKLHSAGAKKLLLGHISRENNLPGLAVSTVCRRLEKEGIAVGQDISVDAAPEKERYLLSAEERTIC